LAVKFYQNQWEQLQAAREKVQQYHQLLRAVPHYQKLPDLQSQLELATENYFQKYPTNFLGEVDAWITSVQSKKEQISNLEMQQLNLKNETTKGEVEMVEYHKNLLGELKKAGFTSMEETESAWKTGDEVREWRQWKSNLEGFEPLLQALEQEIQERENNLSRQPQPALSELEINQELEGRGTALRDAIFYQGNLQKEITIDLESRESAGSKLEEIQSINETLKHWGVLNSAFGDSDGNKFSKIAQQYTLDLLIQVANKKLESFKARYILKQEKHLKGDSHLVVVDQFLGNQIRSVDTLSGGEMFLTSLALAMALSEFAAQNAQLNTLFIDEGFGTLDPDSLNAAMEAIDSIRRQSKKMIGLISHVQELRERIHCQIEVIPKGNGLSSIEIRPKRT
jgi:exonuclease SbcC